MSGLLDSSCPFVFHFIALCLFAQASGILPVNLIFQPLYLICHLYAPVFNSQELFQLLLFSVWGFFSFFLSFLHGSSVISLRILIILEEVFFSLHTLQFVFFFGLFRLYLHEKELRTKKLTGSLELKLGFTACELHCRLSWLAGPFVEQT